MNYRKILNELLDHPENEVVEFKEAKTSYSFDKLGTYFSALSNEAFLKQKDSAWLIFGVNNDQKVVGSKFRNSAKKLLSTNHEIAGKTTNRISFRHIEALDVEGNRVIMFEVPAAPAGIPTAWEGHYYGREGESLGPLSIDEIERIRGVQSIPFEDQVALPNRTGSEVIALINYEVYFNLIKRPVPEPPDALEKFCEEGFLAIRADRFDITNLGAILFARDLSSFPTLARKAVRFIHYKGKDRLNSQNDIEGRKGYVAGFDGLIDYIYGRLPKNEIISEAFRQESKPHPKVAIREFVANALIHQDFSIAGTGPMVELFDGRLEVSNPGEPLIDVLRLIDATPISRNEKLAKAMRRLGICEERGSGIDRAIVSIEIFQSPAPAFILGEKYFRVILYEPKTLRQMTKSDKVRACYQHTVLKYLSDDVATNESLRARFGIEQQNYSIVSRIIKDALNDGFIKQQDPTNKSPRHSRYVPFWVNYATS